MDTSREFQNVLNKKQNGMQISYRDAAVVIGNDPETLLKYMVDNDYVQVHKLLHYSDSNVLIGKNAKFNPNKKAVSAQVLTLLIRKNWKVLNQLVDNFVVNLTTDNYTTNPQLIRALQDIQVLSVTENGLEFNVELS